MLDLLSRTRYAKNHNIEGFDGAVKAEVMSFVESPYGGVAPRDLGFDIAATTSSSVKSGRAATKASRNLAWSSSGDVLPPLGFAANQSCSREPPK
jgi:hypothetical protein